MRNITIILTCFLVFNSCEYIDFINKEGKIVEYDHPIGEIRCLVVDASYRINLTNNTSESAHIKGYDYLVDGLDLATHGDTLALNNDHYFLQKSKLTEVTLSGINLKTITVNAVCELNCTENIKTDNLRIVMNGSSQYTETNLYLTCLNLNLFVFGLNNVGNHVIKGEVKNANYTIEGCVNIDALELEAQKTNVAHKSNGYCKVNTTEELNVNTFSTGNTYYIGTPTVYQQNIDLPYLSSIGEVININ